MIRARAIAANLLVLFLAAVSAFGISEAYLRLFTPFDVRVKGNRIVLPVNRQYVLQNKTIKKLDSTIVYRKNSIGFRGEDPPKNFTEYLSIVTVGGSTTECFYQTDGKTWTDLLGTMLKKSFRPVWINNAGLDGHSTFGHIVLMQDYIGTLKPKLVVFLVGANDRAMRDMGEFDRQGINTGLRFTSLKSFITSLDNRSDVINLLVGKYRTLQARYQGVRHDEIDLARIGYLEMDPRRMQESIDMHRTMYVKLFRERLEKLMRLTISCGIEPVLVTQPALYGFGIDNVSGKDLSKVRVNRINNGENAWRVLELYNDETRGVAEKFHITLIDLAREMPKNSDFFYDWEHLSNAGSERAAGILYSHLKEMLDKRYGVYAIR